MSREIGFRKPTIAVLEKNTETEYKAGKTARLGRGLECKVERKQESVEMFSDDTVEQVMQGDPAYNITITIDRLTDERRVDLFGGQIVKGVYIPPATTVPKEVAYLDEILRSDGTYKKRCFFSGTFSLPSDDNKTKDKKPDSKGVQLKGVFYKRKIDGLSEISLDGAAEDRDKTIEKNWFDSVQEPPAEAKKLE